VIELIAHRVEMQLSRLSSQEPRPFRNASVEKVRQLSRIIQQLYSYVRYLQASDPISSPPGIQYAISAIVDFHVPKALNCAREDVVALVRPQWEYNHKFVDLTRLLERIEVADLDENVEAFGDGETNDMRSFVQDLWEARGLKGKPPKHMAVLSFAGLNRDDVLFYPLLGHEIGHFIDLAFDGTLYDNPRLELQKLYPTNEEISACVRPHAEFEGLELFEKLRLREITRARQSAVSLIDQCLRELTADLLAVRMLGVSFFIALAEYFKTIAPLDSSIVHFSTGYPGSRFRLGIILEELTDPAAGILVEDALLRSMGGRPERAASLFAYLSGWRKLLSEPSGSPIPPADSKAALAELAAQRVRQALPALRGLVREVIPADRAPVPSEHLPMMVDLLRARVPPFPAISGRGTAAGATSVSFADVLTAGWIHELESSAEKNEGWASDRYRDTCSLLFKALELNEAKAAIDSLAGDAGDPSDRPRESLWIERDRAGVKSGPSIVRALGGQADIESRLLIVPYYGDAPLQAASWDIHLGNWFKVAKRTGYVSVDLAVASERARAMQEGQEEVYVRFGEQFVLHPRDFALGVSLEYVALPGSLMAFVEGKSSLGRAGLIIATAAQVAPGFKGGIVLELFNAGTVPLVLRPGMRVAQLVFHGMDVELSKEWLYSGRFRCQVKP
jgi:dCTP deaminase